MNPAAGVNLLPGGPGMSTMPVPGAHQQASALQQHLRELLGHDRIGVRPYGQHLVIELLLPDGAEVVARLTKLEDTTYGASFRNHGGRWEPLHATGSLEELAEVVSQTLGPYLDPAFY